MPQGKKRRAQETNQGQANDRVWDTVRKGDMRVERQGERQSRQGKLVEARKLRTSSEATYGSRLPVAWLNEDVHYNFSVSQQQNKSSLLVPWLGEEG